MIRATPSIPDRCLNCDSENLPGEPPVLFPEGNTILCNFCGLLMVVQGEEEEEAGEFEVSASFVACPHCQTADEIMVAEGAEWCRGCGLDPNQQEYPAEELAHLWTKGSGIRRAMERGIPKNTLTQIYKFLVEKCGPHCTYGKICPQSVGNFTTCLREEDPEERNSSLLQVEGSELGSRKQRRRARKQEEERIRREKERAVLVCASSGWYEERYRNETKDSQKPTHTGGGSGT